MTLEAALRRQLLWSTIAALIGVALAVVGNTMLGALITLPSMALLALTIHKFGRLRAD